MTKSDADFSCRIKRRQFLANLLFAGGALSLASLQGALADPPPPDGWTLPADLQSPNPAPSPQPTETPQPNPPRPPLPGRPQMPQPRGEVAVPQVDGGVRAPRPEPKK